MSGVGVENGIGVLEHWRKGKSVLVKHREVAPSSARIQMGKL